MQACCNSTSAYRFPVRAHAPDAWQFFYHCAGWSYDPAHQSEIAGRTLGAIDLARAESWADKAGALFVWEDDDEPAECWNEATKSYDQLPAVTCVMYLPCAECRDGDVERCDRKLRCHAAASLCGITESDDTTEWRDYRRVVAAELALEAMP